MHTLSPRVQQFIFWPVTDEQTFVGLKNGETEERFSVKISNETEAFLFSQRHNFDYKASWDTNWKSHLSSCETFIWFYRKQFPSFNTNFFLLISSYILHEIPVFYLISGAPYSENRLCYSVLSHPLLRTGRTCVRVLCSAIAVYSLLHKDTVSLYFQGTEDQMHIDLCVLASVSYQLFKIQKVFFKS